MFSPIKRQRKHINSSVDLKKPEAETKFVHDSTSTVKVEELLTTKVSSSSKKISPAKSKIAPLDANKKVSEMACSPSDFKIENGIVKPSQIEVDIRNKPESDEKKVTEGSAKKKPATMEDRVKD